MQGQRRGNRRPLPTRVNVVANEDAWKRLRSHRLNPCVWLRHEVDQGAEGELHALKIPFRVPLVPSGIPVDDGNVVGKTEMFTSERPKRLGVETRLDHRTAATFFASTDAVFGDAVGLRHPRSGSSQPPTQCCSRGYKLRRIVTIEIRSFIISSSIMLKSFDSVFGGLGRFRVDVKLSCASVE